MLPLATLALTFSSATPSCEAGHDVVYAFSLTDLDQAKTDGLHIPADECFSPITLHALKASGHLEYTWVPWSLLKSDLAPHGAFVYKLEDGSILYKAITAVAPDDPSAVLKFHAQTELVETTFFGATSFDAVMQHPTDTIVSEMQRGIKCGAADISYTTTEPFAGYSKAAARPAPPPFSPLRRSSPRCASRALAVLLGRRPLHAGRPEQRLRRLCVRAEGRRLGLPRVLNEAASGGWKKAGAASGRWSPAVGSARTNFAVGGE